LNRHGFAELSSVVLNLADADGPIDLIIVDDHGRTRLTDVGIHKLLDALEAGLGAVGLEDRFDAIDARVSELAAELNNLKLEPVACVCETAEHLQDCLDRNSVRARLFDPVFDERLRHLAAQYSTNRKRGVDRMGVGGFSEGVHFESPMAEGVGAPNDTIGEGAAAVVSYGGSRPSNSDANRREA
jgi:hypothetical protein